MAVPIFELRNKAKRGSRGHPLATLAFYGPDDKLATKSVLGIFLHDGDDGTLHRFFKDDGDIRQGNAIAKTVLTRLKEHDVRSFIMVDRIFGCPHEEGIDYPEGESCPQCPFWKDRDRFAGLE